MNTIVLTNSNAGTNQKHKLSLRLTNPMRLVDCLVCVSDISMYYSWPNIKSTYRNNTFKYKRLTDNREFDVTLDDGGYEVKEINNYFKMIMEKNEEKKDDKGEYPIQLYDNSTYYSVTVVTKDNYVLQLPISGLGYALGFTKPANEGDKYVSIGPKMEKNSDDIPQIDHVFSVLVHCNLVNNKYVLDDALVYSFTPNQKYATLLNIKPNFPQWRNARNNADINEIEVWFTDQDNKPLEMKDPKVRVELQIASASIVKL